MARNVDINVTEVTNSLNGHIVAFTARRGGLGEPVSDSLQIPFSGDETPETLDAKVVAYACGKVNAVAGDVVWLFGGCGRRVEYAGPA